MSVKYTNNEGQTFCLFEYKNTRGRTRYYFSSESHMSTPSLAVPEGYEIFENEKGNVFLRKKDNYLEKMKHLF